MFIKLTDSMDPTELRFTLGSRVECIWPVEANGIWPVASGQWKPGEVVSFFYVGCCFPEGMCAPYQVKLDDGTLVFAPTDSNTFIRQQGHINDDDEGDSAAAGEDKDKNDGNEPDGDGDDATPEL